MPPRLIACLTRPLMSFACRRILVKNVTRLTASASASVARPHLQRPQPQQQQQQRRNLATKRQKRAAAAAAAAAAKHEAPSSELAMTDVSLTQPSQDAAGALASGPDGGTSLGERRQDLNSPGGGNQRHDDGGTMSIDVKTLYDPTIHLPDKPDFNDPSLGYEEATPLSDELTKLIALRGPITLAEYMRQTLTHPDHGYYTSPSSKRDEDDDYSDDDEYDETSTDLASDNIIGRRGDFTTAPEISQVYSECILVWFMTQYQSMGSPSKIQLVEVGPGRGTLMGDVLSAASKTFPKFLDAACAGGGVHMVETSYDMRKSQRGTIKEAMHVTPFMVETDESDFTPFHVEDLFQDNGHQIETESEMLKKMSGSSDNAGKTNSRVLPIRWHHVLATVPNDPDASGPQFVVAQEFVDALPVHSFQKTDGGVWRERLVDVDAREADDSSLGDDLGVGDGPSILGKDDNRPPGGGGGRREDGGDMKSPEKKTRLRFVLSPGTTPALRSLMNADEKGRVKTEVAPRDDSVAGDILEVCPEGMSLMQDVARRINKCGGAALIVDYGSGMGTGDSVRAFRRHEQVHVLSLPGRVDVTADVDFGALSYAVGQVDGDARAFGPVTQGRFLAAMGAVERVSSLIDEDSTTDKQATDLYLALERLLLPEQMGERYKVMSIVKSDGQHNDTAPPGFE